MSEKYIIMKNRYNTISIAHYNVEQRLFTYSYYVGEARRATGVPAQQTSAMQASSDDRAQILDHLHMALTDVTRFMNRYFRSCSCKVGADSLHDGYEMYEFTFFAPERFPENMLPQLLQCVESYLVMRTLNMWMLQHKPDEAVLSAAEAEKLLVQLRELMNLRTKPQSAKRTTRKNIEI